MISSSIGNARCMECRCIFTREEGIPEGSLKYFIAKTVRVRSLKRRGCTVEFHEDTPLYVLYMLYGALVLATFISNEAWLIGTTAAMACHCLYGT